MFSAPLSNTIDKLLLATGDSDMKWKIGRGSEMEERLCKSFTGLLFLHACVSLWITDWRWHWGFFVATPHWSQMGQGRSTGHWGSTEKSPHSAECTNGPKFIGLLVPLLTRDNLSSQLLVTKMWLNTTFSLNNMSHLQYCCPYILYIQNLNTTNTLH